MLWAPKRVLPCLVISTPRPQLDWRPLLPHIQLPCLNLIGQLSGVFPEAGCRAVSNRIPNCHTVMTNRSYLPCCSSMARSVPSAALCLAAQLGRIPAKSGLLVNGQLPERPPSGLRSVSIPIFMPKP